MHSAPAVQNFNAHTRSSAKPEHKAQCTNPPEVQNLTSQTTQSKFIVTLLNIPLCSKVHCCGLWHTFELHFGEKNVPTPLKTGRRGKQLNRALDQIISTASGALVAVVV